MPAATEIHAFCRRAETSNKCTIWSSTTVNAMAKMQPK